MNPAVRRHSPSTATSAVRCSRCSRGKLRQHQHRITSTAVVVFSADQQFVAQPRPLACPVGGVSRPLWRRPRWPDEAADWPLRFAAAGCRRARSLTMPLTPIAPRMAGLATIPWRGSPFCSSRPRERRAAQSYDSGRRIVERCVVCAPSLVDQRVPGRCLRLVSDHQRRGEQSMTPTTRSSHVR